MVCKKKECLIFLIIFCVLNQKIDFYDLLEFQNQQMDVFSLFVVKASYALLHLIKMI